MHTATAPTPPADTPVSHLLARMRIGADLARLDAAHTAAVVLLPSFAVIDDQPAWVTWSGPDGARSAAAGDARLSWAVRGARGVVAVAADGTWTGELPPGSDAPRVFTPHAQALASFAADAAMAQWELVQQLAPRLDDLARTYAAAQYVILDTDALVRRLRFGISWRSAPSPVGRALGELVTTEDLARVDVETGIWALLGELVHRSIDQLLADLDLAPVLTRLRETPAPTLDELIDWFTRANPGHRLHPAAFVAALERAAPVPPELTRSLADDAARLEQAG